MFTATYFSEKIRKALVTLVTYQELKSFRKAALKIGVIKSTIHSWWHSFHMLLGVRSRHQKGKKRRTRKRKFDGLVQREGCNNVDFAKDTGQGDKAITVHILH